MRTNMRMRRSRSNASPDTSPTKSNCCDSPTNSPKRNYCDSPSNSPPSSPKRSYNSSSSNSLKRDNITIDNSIPMLPRSNSHTCRNKHHHNSHHHSHHHSNHPSCSGEIDCLCKESNILTRPWQYEETCFIFETVENTFNVTAKTILSLKHHVTEVIYPFTENYDFYRLNFNHRFNRYPVAIVKAHTIEDIVHTIHFCQKTGIPLRVRGGTHAYEPASLVNFGIIIDQRPRNKVVHIDHKNNLVQIQGGALLGPVINELAKHDALVPWGTCVTNGLAGLTLGGGIGFGARMYGLTLDAVTDMKVVLADKSIVHANDKSNEELFWALRGAGGGNFGVVTDFTFRYEVTKHLTIFTINYDFDYVKPVMKVWQEWAPYVTEKLTTEMDVFNRFQPVIVTGQLLPVHSKERDKALLIELLKPLLDLKLHSNFTIQSMNLKEASKYFGEGSYARPLFFYNKSHFNFNPLPDEAIDVMIYHMGLLKKTQSFHKTEMDALGGNFSKNSSDSTAFPWRDAIHWFQFTSLWDISEEEEENRAWLDAYYADIGRFFPENAKYVNALDYSVTDVRRALESYYGDNLGELVKVKNKYDPQNFFQFEQSVPVTLKN